MIPAVVPSLDTDMRRTGAPLARAPHGLFLAVATLVAPGLAAAVQQVGPANGSLVVAGGALRDPAVLARFVELAGGPSAPIVVIPTAGGAAEGHPLGRVVRKPWPSGLPLDP